MSLPAWQASSSPPDDDLMLSEYAQNILPDLKPPTLLLISHGHSPPLTPSPQLRFDVRSLPNPPKHIRDAHNGTSKSLQEWMRADPSFLRRRDAIRSEIEAAMKDMTVAHENGVLRSGARAKDETNCGDSHCAGSDQKSYENEGSSGQASANDDTVDSRDPTNTLRVGIYCAMGRHRSVAMVENLRKLPWPGWGVQVEHRDISKKRGVGKKSGQGIRGGSMSMLFDDD